MLSISASLVLLLSALLHLNASLPLRGEGEAETFLTHIRHVNAPRPESGTTPGDALQLQARLRQLLSAGLERRRQLGDLEFSNRYAEFLRSKAKHNSICPLLRRMQGVKKSYSPLSSALVSPCFIHSGVGGDVERVNLLLKQYMCPSIYNNWPTDL